MITAIWIVAFLVLATWSGMVWVFYAKFGEAFDPGTDGILSFLQGFFAVADGAILVIVIAVWLCGVAALMLLTIAAVSVAMWLRKKKIAQSNTQ